jgi:CheY-like chemotaxis protein
MRTLLVKWEIEVATAKNHDDALQVSKDFAPQILLVDYQLGNGPDGLAIIDSIRSQLNTVVPACLITAERSDKLVKLCKDHGVNYLSKPLKPAKLRTLIQSMTKFIKAVKVSNN